MYEKVGAVICCSWSLFLAVVARCFSLLFGRRDRQQPRNFAAFAGQAAVFLWQNSENSAGSR